MDQDYQNHDNISKVIQKQNSAYQARINLSSHTELSENEHRSLVWNFTQSGILLIENKTRALL